MGEKLLVTYCLNIETVLIYCVSVWWSHYSEVDKKRLQRVSQTAPSLPEGHFSLPLAELRTSSKMAPILTFICSTSRSKYGQRYHRKFLLFPYTYTFLVISAM